MESLYIFLWNSFNNLPIDFFSVSCWHNCTGERIKYKNRKIIFSILIMALSTTTLNLILPKILRMFIVLLLLTFICNYLLKRNIKETILLVLISQSVIWLSEFSFAILISAFYKGDIQQITQRPIIFLILNLYIATISFVVQKIGLPKKMYTLLNPNANNSNINDALFYSILMVVIMIVATMETYMKLPFTIVIITNTIMALIFVGIIIMSRKLKANYNKISSKYENSISSLKEYEVMIDKFRVDTHENKNEFRTIRNMLKAKAKKDDVIKYIDKLIDNKIKDNDKIMKKTAKIPEGGLRATIYSKLCLMDTLNVKYRLNISRDVRTTDLINLDEDLVLKICKILGVFLDNAIEAVKELNKKEIVVEIYTMDNNLCIDITNNFKGSLDLEKISNIKYTTKGDGHGYGLTLVKKLLEEESDKLENEKSINRDTFTQTLKIKM